jgi:protoporphyrinogen oxidase
LRYNAIYIAMIAVNDTSLMDKSAIYIPDPEVLPHRVCYMGFFSPNMVREGTSSLIAEITCRPGSDVDNAGKDWVLQKSIDDLDRVGVIRKENVIATEIRRIEYAYPVYDLHYTKNSQIVRNYFSSIGVHLLGRFAEFEYINSDECLRRAVALAERLNQREISVAGTPEEVGFVGGAVAAQASSRK